MRPALAILTLVAVALTALLLSCGDTEEEIAPAITPTPAGTGPTPTIAAPTPSPLAGTPVPVPSGWKRYSDPSIGLSLSYPADLVFQDLSGPSRTSGATEIHLQFRAPNKHERSLTIAGVNRPKEMTIVDWVRGATACLPNTIKETKVAGQQAIACTNQPEMLRESAVIFEHGGLIFFISSIMPEFGYESEFEAVIQSIALS